MQVRDCQIGRAPECGVAVPVHGAAWLDFFIFFGRGTGPKRCGAVLACFWTDFQAKPSILDPSRAVFDDLGPNRHFGPDFDRARAWPGGLGTRPGTGREALAQPILCFSHKNMFPFFSSSAGGRLPPRPTRKSRAFFFWAGGQIQDSHFLASGLDQGLLASPWPGPGDPSQAQNVSLVQNHQK